MFRTDLLSITKSLITVFAAIGILSCFLCWLSASEVRMEHADLARGMEVYLYSCCTKVGAGWGGWLSPRSGTQTRYPSYRKLSGYLGQSRRVRKISPSPGFDSRTVQFVACRYTAYATPAHTLSVAADMNLKNVNILAIGLHRLAIKKWHVRNSQDTDSRSCVQNMFSCTSIYDT